MTIAFDAHDVDLWVGPPKRRRAIVSGLSVEIPSGRWTALIGPNGAGKTTLLRAFAGLHRPDRGVINFSGHPIHLHDPRARAKRIAWLPQASHLWGDPPVLAVVLLGRTPYLGAWGRVSVQDREQARVALDRVHALPLADRPVSTLSGGERQRVMLARMLASKADVLLLDEPTTALDVRHSLEVLRLCSELRAAGTTLITAVHDIDSIRDLVDLVVCLPGDNRPAHAGPAATILSPSVLEPAFKVRVQIQPRLHFSLADQTDSDQPSPSANG